MLALIYRFYPYSNSHFGVQATMLAPCLAKKMAIRLERMTAIPFPNPDWKSLYPLINQSLEHPRLVLHHGPLTHFQKHPTAWNLAWIDWEMEKKNTHLDQLQHVDEIWVTSDAEKRDLCQSQEIDQDRVLIISPPLDPSELTAELSPPPFDPGDGFKFFHMGDWANFEPTIRLLETFVLAFADREDVSLILRIHSAGEQATIETELSRQLQQIVVRNGLDAVKAPIMTLIGATERNVHLGILNCSQAVLTTGGYQLALETLLLGKKLLSPAHPVLTPYLEKLELYPFELENQEQAISQLRSVVNAQPPQLQAAIKSHFLEEVNQQIFERLQWLDEHVDLSERQQKESRANQAYQREGRQQKYSLFHQDFNEQELAARRQWHHRYAQYFKDCQQEVLDVGCGSGIFLELLRDMLVPGVGLDFDQDMVDVCKELGLKAVLGDDRKIGEYHHILGGIHASHIIEHLDGNRAMQFLENCWQALTPGGILVIRTPNWRNQTVRHEGFWLDHTHIRPYPLPLLQQFFKDIGFDVLADGFEDNGWNDTFIVGKKK